jgi:hypothetical protein
MPVHELRLFGAWLSADTLQETTALAQQASYLLRKVKLLAAAVAALSPADVGCMHSLRHGGATELQAAGAAPDPLMQALQIPHIHHAPLCLTSSSAAAVSALRVGGGREQMYA